MRDQFVSAGPVPDDSVSIAEACELLGVKQNTFTKWCVLRGGVRRFLERRAVACWTEGPEKLMLCCSRGEVLSKGARALRRRFVMKLRTDRRKRFIREAHAAGVTYVVIAEYLGVSRSYASDSCRSRTPTPAVRLTRRMRSRLRWWKRRVS